MCVCVCVCSEKSPRRCAWSETSCSTWQQWSGNSLCITVICTHWPQSVLLLVTHCPQSLLLWSLNVLSSIFAVIGHSLSSVFAAIGHSMSCLQSLLLLVTHCPQSLLLLVTPQQHHPPACNKRRSSKCQRFSQNCVPPDITCGDRGKIGRLNKSWETVYVSLSSF